MLVEVTFCDLASEERSKKSMPRSAKIRLKRWPSFASHSSRLRSQALAHSCGHSGGKTRRERFIDILSIWCDVQKCEKGLAIIIFIRTLERQPDLPPCRFSIRWLRNYICMCVRDLVYVRTWACGEHRRRYGMAISSLCNDGWQIVDVGRQED